MPPEIYKELLDLIRPLITRRDTNFRRAISAEERLSLTIRYLTTGDYLKIEFSLIPEGSYVLSYFYYFNFT